MGQMKERKALQLHFTWVEPWVQDLALVCTVALLHSQQLETTCFQTLAAKTINLVGSKSKINKLYTPFTHSLCVGIIKIVELFGVVDFVDMYFSNYCDYIIIDSCYRCILMLITSSSILQYPKNW